MSASRLESAVNKTNLFNTNTGSLLSTSGDFQPRGISEQTFIIVTSTLAAAIILVILIGAIHFIRRRYRHQNNEKRQQQDMEQSLQRARRPVLTIDTDLPHTNDFTRSAGRATLPDLPFYNAAPPVPLAQVMTAPLTTHGSAMSALGPTRAHGAIRNPSSSHTPGLAGRDTRIPAYQNARFEETSFKELMQIHNPHNMRGVYST